VRRLRVLGLIPARGGSKGIPRKNLAPLMGKPLLAYTAAAALQARRLARVVLSTDDETIAEVGRSLGLDAPFLRPAELALDETPMLPVVQHAVRALEQQGEHYDAVCLLQPTSPLRSGEMIDGCIRQLEQSDAEAVVSVCEVPHHFNPHWVYFGDPATGLHLSTGEAQPIGRRQALPPAYHREGSVYVTMRDVLMEANSLYGNRLMGYLVDPATSVNIDSPADLVHAGQMVRQA
jgi:CMP-N,N'-diacetyllegionaminic acid synthase